jgi:hypothetical protein
LALPARFLIEVPCGLGLNGPGEAAATWKFQDIGEDPGIAELPGFRGTGNIIAGDIAGSPVTGDSFYKNIKPVTKRALLTRRFFLLFYFNIF